ncbi:NifU family protein [Streptomyces sp. NPDC051322]|uniref:NifU family protein n=1 Tax=Streptomyces sp. NPDC051322 TaxID=3154645 RepID=UPI00344F0B97
MTDHGRLDAPAIGQRLARIDELLERVEGTPGPTSDAAIEAVQALAEVYGEALARVRDLADPQLSGRLVDDELLGHLMVLHEIHPDPLEHRVVRALDNLRPAVRKHGGEMELTGISDGVASVRLTVKGCGSSAAPVEEAVREAVLAAAPELSAVRWEPAAEQPDAAFVPLDSVTRRPVASGGTA